MWLPVTQSLDLETTLHSGQVFRWELLEGCWNGFVNGILVSIREHSSGLEYEFAESDRIAYPDGGTNALDMGNLLSSFFRLDDDLSVVRDELSRDSYLATAMQYAPGLRLLRQEPWECLVSFICSTNSNIPRIAGVIERIANRFGTRKKLRNFEKHSFPTASELAQSNEKELRGLGLGYRAPYVLQTAEMIAEKRLSLESLVNEDYEIAKEGLLRLPGVGEKVADCVLLFALNQSTAFPIDVWIRRVLEREYLLPKNLSYGALSRWARERFGPWAGYAQQYLYYLNRWGGNTTSIEIERMQ